MRRAIWPTWPRRGPATRRQPRHCLDRWRHQRNHEGGAAVLRTLEGLDRSGRGPEALEEHRLVTQYLRKNAYRMDYPAYQQRGWQIGSGSMESGCKTVICQRLCGGGMRWGTDGADSVSHPPLPRCYFC